MGCVCGDITLNWTNEEGRFPKMWNVMRFDSKLGDSALKCVVSILCLSPFTIFILCFPFFYCDVAPSSCTFYCNKQTDHYNMWTHQYIVQVSFRTFRIVLNIHTRSACAVASSRSTKFQCSNGWSNQGASKQQNAFVQYVQVVWLAISLYVALSLSSFALEPVSRVSFVYIWWPSMVFSGERHWTT